MSEEKKKAVGTLPDVNQFYTVLKGYIEYCIQNPKTKLTDKEKGGLSDKEIAAKTDELKAAAQNHDKQKKSYQKAYDAMCEKIAQEGISYLTVYVDALKKLYEDKSDWKRDIKTALVSSKSLKLFRGARVNMVDLYSVLMTVNKTFPVENYSELSLSPKAAMYGSEVNKTQKGSTKKSPIKNEEYQVMLEMFLQVKDYKSFGDWLMAILVFAPDQLLKDFQSDYIPLRETLKEWAYEQINSNESYKQAVVDTLIKNRMLNSLVDAFVALPAMKSKHEELETRIKQKEEYYEKEKAAHEEQRVKQYEIIQEKKAMVANLHDELQDFKRCSDQLTVYMEKYQAQLSMNERITLENDRRIKEMEVDNDRMQDELTEVTAQLDELKTTYAALQSDYSLKNNELMRLKNMTAQKEETARVDMMHELVSGINEQFFYLTLFCLELKDTGKLEPESIELYADTLSKIDNVLAKLGIKKIGVIDQTVSYDASIHVSTDTKLSNGDKVVISGYGWKIGEEVYLKAPVEKGEQ